MTTFESAISHQEFAIDEKVQIDIMNDILSKIKS
jgi:hypothetical protein